MKYVGSKNRHYKEILPIILKDRKPNQYYVEPFVGGFNLIDKVEGKRIGNDNHYYLIQLFKQIQKGWHPPYYISEKEYNEIRDNKHKFSPWLVGFVGFGCSYSGKWFGGYARAKKESRNYCEESRNNLLKQYDGLQGIEIFNEDYKNLVIPSNSIVYCDPPYFKTTKYKVNFDYQNFWDWVRNLVKENHVVYVSEYTAPEDFTCVWEKKVNNTLVQQTGSKQGIERLFVLS